MWDDDNSNGIQDSGEAGIANVTVKLLNASNTVVGTTTTDANGKYLFNNLIPGTYSVQFFAPSGLSFSPANQGADDAKDSDANTATGKTGTYTLAAGQTNLTVDAGLVHNCVPIDFSGGTSTSGTVGNIRNFNGAGVSVNVSGFSRDRATGAWATAYLGSYGGGLGVTDTSEGTGANNTHTVDNTGGRDNYVLFEFNNNVLLDEAFLGYVVGDSDLQLWIGNFSNAFNNHQTLSDSMLAAMGFTEVNLTDLTTTRTADLNAGGFVGNVVVVAADTTDTTPEDYFKIQTLCIIPPAAGPASLGDFVWHDLNANGLQDSGEPGIAYVTASLLNAANTVVGTTMTDANGKYLFTNLIPGTYSVQFQDLSSYGYIRTLANIGSNDSIDSDAITATGKTGTYALAAGQTNLTVDAGYYRSASLGDFVWHDLNANGLQDSGEPGIAYVTVNLLNAANSVVGTTMTDATGKYLFSNLIAGTYSVQFQDLSSYGYIRTLANIGSNDSIDSDAIVATGNTGTYALASGQSNLTVDAGYYKNASLGDYVFEDCNGNGKQDTGDTAIAGVTVKLLDSTGTNVLAATSTNASGLYSFTVVPGTYVIQFVAPSGYVFTAQFQGSDTTKDSNANITTGKTAAVGLTSGQSDLTVDGGMYRPASIDGFVYKDFNNNGVIDLGDAGIGGVTMTLSGVDGTGATVTKTTTTDSTGYYRFDTLRPGTYKVTETQPAGYADGKDSVGSLGGTLGNDMVSNIVLTCNAQAMNYNFGELASTSLGHGMTATIGFWHNNNGQALIKSLNGGQTATALGNWLATTFPNIYGNACGVNNMTGKTNAQVAAYFLTLFNVTGQKLEAQVLATALAVYVTKSSLAGGTMAASYGFTVNSTGTGAKTYNVGANGAAFGVANNTTLTILQILQATNSQSVNGVLYNGDSTKRNMANTIYDGINTKGDIV